MNPFKVGDRVICLHNSGATKAGAVYEVTGVYKDTDGERISYINSEGRPDGWHISHFKLAPPPCQCETCKRIDNA